MTLLKILLPLGILSLVYAQFPRKCINRADLLGRVCCPIGEDGTMCNNGTMKGVCSSFTQFHYYIGKPEIQSRVNRDDRGHWPSHFFNHLCTCQGNFGGPDCGRCEPGYEGKNCDVKSPLKIRKNALSLSKEEKKRFVETVAKSKREIDPDYVIMTRHQTPELTCMRLIQRMKKK